MENKKTKEKYNKKIVKGLFAILVTTILMLSVVPALPFATDIGTHVNEKSIVTAKAAKVKVTWNANGGKIGTKKTTVTSVKKGTKLKKLQTAPKRSGYAFKGWYTKKTGGTKITKNTKPKKKVTYYAQWKKGNSNTTNTNNTVKRVLTAEEKKLVGKWVLHWDGSSMYEFKADGTYLKVASLKSYDAGFRGYYSLKNGILKLTYQHSKDYTGNGFKIWGDWEESSPQKIKFYTREDGSQYFEIDDGLAYDKRV